MKKYLAYCTGENFDDVLWMREILESTGLFSEFNITKGTCIGVYLKNGKFVGDSLYLYELSKEGIIPIIHVDRLPLSITMFDRYSISKKAKFGCLGVITDKVHDTVPFIIKSEIDDEGFIDGILLMSNGDRVSAKIPFFSVIKAYSLDMSHKLFKIIILQEFIDNPGPFYVEYEDQVYFGDSAIIEKILDFDGLDVYFVIDGSRTLTYIKDGVIVNSVNFSASLEGITAEIYNNRISWGDFVLHDTFIQTCLNMPFFQGLEVSENNVINREQMVYLLKWIKLKKGAILLT